MTDEELYNLQQGQRVANKAHPDVIYLVTDNYGNRATAVATVDITNPSEWLIVGTNRLTVIEIFRNDEVISSNGKVHLVIRNNRVIYNRVRDGDNYEFIQSPQDS